VKHWNVSSYFKNRSKHTILDDVGLGIFDSYGSRNTGIEKMQDCDVMSIPQIRMLCLELCILKGIHIQDNYVSLIQTQDMHTQVTPRYTHPIYMYQNYIYIP
jgi:hypothetical protein